MFCSALIVKTAVVSKRVAPTTHILAMTPYRPQFDDCISCIFKLCLFFHFSFTSVTHVLCFFINAQYISSPSILLPVSWLIVLFIRFHPTDYTYSALFLECRFCFCPVRNSIQRRLSFYFLRWQKQQGKECNKMYWRQQNELRARKKKHTHEHSYRTLWL